MNAKRRRSIRLRGYDYATPGGYFVTLCTNARAQLFGEVIDGLVRLTEFGRIAKACWQAIPSHFPFVELDAFVVMPNHVHGILLIHPAGRGTACRAPTLQASVLPATDDSLTQEHEAFSRPVAGSLPTIIRSYKAAVTRACREAGHPGPLWQRNYYEHVIRGERELRRLREYIASNPGRWASDAENPERPHQDPARAPRKPRQGR